MSILKTLFQSEDPTPQSELDAQETAFDAANAAIDRAIAERQAADTSAERRVNEPNRRNGGYPPGRFTGPAYNPPTEFRTAAHVRVNCYAR